MSRFQVLIDKDPTKYPSRMGKKWEEDEVERLLSSIESKKSIDHIAIEHQRTVGGINAKRKGLAVDYWYIEKKPVEEILTLTGLTNEEFQETIKRRDDPTKPKEAKGDATKKPNIEILQLKREVKEIKEDIKKILELMNAVYEFETSQA